MKKEFRLPDVGEGLTEADIVSWHVKPGDTVTINQIIVDIETAKAVVELPSPYAGTVTALLVDEGQTVDVGTPIIAVNVPGPEDAATEPAQPENPAAEAKAAPAPEAKDAPGSGARQPVLVGYGVKPGSTSRRPTEEAADAAGLLPGHPVRAADRRAGRPPGVPRGSQASPRRPRSAPHRPIGPARERRGRAPSGGRAGGSPPVRGVTGRPAPGGRQGPGEAARATPRQRSRRRPWRADGKRAGRLGHQGRCRAGGGRGPHPFGS